MEITTLTGKEYEGTEEMPAKSEAQQKLMAIALHHPEKLYDRNKDVAKMDKGDLREFAETKRADLPKRVNWSSLSKKRKDKKAKAERSTRIIGTVR